MKFLWTTLSVSNLERSLQFYQSVVGLPLQRRMDPPGMAMAFLGTGDTALELIEDRRHPQVDLRNPVSLGFEVPDLDATLQDFRARGITIDAGPLQPNPGVKFFYVRDPDGMNVQFVEQIPSSPGLR